MQSCLQKNVYYIVLLYVLKSKFKSMANDAVNLGTDRTSPRITDIC